MKFCCLALILLLASGLGFCQSTKTDKKDAEIIIVAQSENRKYNLTAIFYGVNFHFEDEKDTVVKIIKHVGFRDNKTGVEVRYEPTGGLPAGDFYFTEVWSPDEEYLILPIGIFEGFGTFKAKDALEDIKSNKFFDTIKVKSENSGWFGHKFEKWENGSTFVFRAGLDGDIFAFKYNVTKNELYCYEFGCEENGIGRNSKGQVKPIKKGNIEPTKIH